MAAIDPQGALGGPEISGFNYVKLALTPDKRSGKALALRQCKHDIVILGTSRAESGIDLDHPAFKGRRVYNAALKAATMYEMSRIVDYMLRYQTPDAVILSLDFVAFSDERLSADDFSLSPLAESLSVSELIPYLVSINSIYEAQQTIRWNLRGVENKCTDRGAPVRTWPAPPARKAFDITIAQYADYQHYRSFALGQKHMESLKESLTALVSKGVRVYAFISPMHVVQFEIMENLHVRDSYAMWQKRLVDLFASVNKQLPPDRQIALWDFSGYHAVSTVRIPALETRARLRGFSDSAHYTKEVGDMIIDKIMLLSRPATNSVAASDFGVRLDEDNIEQYLVRQIRAAKEWRDADPEEVIRVANLVAETIDREQAQ